MAESPDNGPQLGLPAKKQLAYLGQFLLGVCLTALFFQLRIADSRAQREDYESITALGSLTEMPVHRVLANPGAFFPDNHPESSFPVQFDKAVQSAVHSWLASNQPDLDQHHREARDTVAAWIQEGGLAEQEVREFSGKGRGDRIPFLFFRVAVRPLHSRFGTEAHLIDNPPVGLLLDEVRHLGAPVTLTVAQNLNRSDLPPLDLRLFRGASRGGGFGAPQADRQKSYRVESIALNDSDRLVVTFVEDVGSSQRVPDRQQKIIPVTTREVPARSILEIVSSSLHASRLAQIATDEGRSNRLNEMYGELRLDNARTMTGSRMLASFQDVEILGFKFSPQYFWIFTFAFLAVALLAIAVHLWRAVPDDEPTAFGLDALLGGIAFRTVLWCAIPPAAMLLARPRDSSSGWASSWWLPTAYWVAFASLVATGAWLVWLSIRVSRGDGKPGSEPSQGARGSDQAASLPVEERQPAEVPAASARGS
jgi:hypothetical protein